MDGLIYRDEAINYLVDKACEQTDHGASWEALTPSDIEYYLKKIPVFEANLLINPETIERGCETYIGENIVVVHHDDFMDMKCKAMMWDEYGENKPQRDCFLCKWLGDVDICGRCRNRNLFAEKDEPQTERNRQ